MNDQLSKQALKKLKKKVDAEYDSRTDITGHFKNEYDQGFCDGADWFFKIAEKEISSPSLTDEQQVVLEWLKGKMTLTDIEPIELIWRLRVNSTKEGYRDMPVYKSYRYMTKAGQFQVLAAFAEWGMSQEDDE